MGWLKGGLCDIFDGNVWHEGRVIGCRKNQGASKDGKKDEIVFVKLRTAYPHYYITTSLLAGIANDDQNNNSGHEPVAGDLAPPYSHVFNWREQTLSSNVLLQNIGFQHQYTNYTNVNQNMHLHYTAGDPDSRWWVSSTLALHNYRIGATEPSGVLQGSPDSTEHSAQPSLSSKSYTSFARGGWDGEPAEGRLALSLEGEVPGFEDVRISYVGGDPSEFQKNQLVGLYTRQVPLKEPPRYQILNADAGKILCKTMSWAGQQEPQLELELHSDVIRRLPFPNIGQQAIPYVWDQWMPAELKKNESFQQQFMSLFPPSQQFETVRMAEMQWRATLSVGALCDCFDGEKWREARIDQTCGINSANLTVKLRDGRPYEYLETSRQAGAQRGKSSEPMLGDLAKPYTHVHNWRAELAVGDLVEAYREDPHCYRNEEANTVLHCTRGLANHSRWRVIDFYGYLSQLTRHSFPDLDNGFLQVVGQPNAPPTSADGRYWLKSVKDTVQYVKDGISWQPCNDGIVTVTSEPGECPDHNNYRITVNERLLAATFPGCVEFIPKISGLFRYQPATEENDVWRVAKLELNSLTGDVEVYIKLGTLNTSIDLYSDQFFQVRTFRTMQTRQETDVNPGLDLVLGDWFTSVQSISSASKMAIVRSIVPLNSNNVDCLRVETAGSGTIVLHQFLFDDTTTVAQLLHAVHQTCYLQSVAYLYLDSHLLKELMPHSRRLRAAGVTNGDVVYAVFRRHDKIVCKSLSHWQMYYHDSGLVREIGRIVDTMDSFETVRTLIECPLETPITYPLPKEVAELRELEILRLPSACLTGWFTFFRFVICQRGYCVFAREVTVWPLRRSTAERAGKFASIEVDGS